MLQLVNEKQTPAERREKYEYLRALGLNSYLAKRCRDWRLTVINARIDSLVRASEARQTRRYVKARQA